MLDWHPHVILWAIKRLLSGMFVVYGASSGEGAGLVNSPRFFFPIHSGFIAHYHDATHIGRLISSVPPSIIPGSLREGEQGITYREAGGG